MFLKKKKKHLFWEKTFLVEKKVGRRNPPPPPEELQFCINIMFKFSIVRIYFKGMIIDTYINFSRR